MMAEKDQTIVLTCPAGSKEWSAVCPDYPEHVTTGYTSMDALRQYNYMLWRMSYEKQDRLDSCFRAMRKEIRKAAGIPTWALGLPSWLLWNKKERDEQYDRMNEIVKRFLTQPKFKNAKYEELTQVAIQEFNRPPPLPKGYKPLDEDVVEILSR